VLKVTSFQHICNWDHRNSLGNASNNGTYCIMVNPTTSTQFRFKGHWKSFPLMFREKYFEIVLYSWAKLPQGIQKNFPTRIKANPWLLLLNWKFVGRLWSPLRYGTFKWSTKHMHKVLSGFFPLESVTSRRIRHTKFSFVQSFLLLLHLKRRSKRT
jgi:hypothetical protein